MKGAGEDRTPYVVRARDFEQLAEMVKRRDVGIARALAEAALDAAEDGAPGPYGITVEFEDGSYAVMDFEPGQTEEVRGSLEDSLQDFEKQEWYELCARVKRYLAGATEKPKKKRKAPRVRD